MYSRLSRALEWRGHAPAFAMSTNIRIVGAVEIGTARVKVVVGSLRGSKISILGHAERPSRGVIKGEIVDSRAACDCAHHAIAEAEKRAGQRIDHVLLAQTGGHIVGTLREGDVTVTSFDEKVCQSAIDEARCVATARKLPAGQVVIHYLRRPYSLDRRRISGNPEGRVGHRLTGGWWIVHGSEARISDALQVLGAYLLPVKEVLVSGLASGVTVTTVRDRKHGCLVIDLGAGTTDYALFSHDHVYIAGVVPVGGAHLTNDLALGLRLTLKQAEKLKLQYGRALVSNRDQDEKVWLEGNFAIGDRQFSRHAIEEITAVRTREIFEIVKRQLGVSFQPKTCPAGVILTGGMSRLRGSVNCARQVFRVPSRLGEPPRSVKGKLREPGFSTVLGLFYYGLPAPARRR